MQQRSNKSGGRGVSTCVLPRVFYCLHACDEAKPQQRTRKGLEIFRDISRYFEILRDISRYFEILRDTSRGLEILREVSRYFEMFGDTSGGFEIFRDAHHGKGGRGIESQQQLAVARVAHAYIESQNRAHSPKGGGHQDIWIPYSRNVSASLDEAYAAKQ
eukprot:SAG31_NODE_1194_length_9448_cov_9.896887_10_plen_159_part_01